MNGSGKTLTKQAGYETVNVRKDEYKKLCKAYSDAVARINELETDCSEKQRLIDALQPPGLYEPLRRVAT